VGVGALGSVAITPDGKHALVTSGDYTDNNGTVSVITTATGKASPPITVDAVSPPIAVRSAPLVISPDSKHAYLISADNSAFPAVDTVVLVIDTATGVVSGRILVGPTGDFAPVPLAICPAPPR
jgi:DNA-binding beta-propeller fold protein YncE